MAFSPSFLNFRSLDATTVPWPPWRANGLIHKSRPWGATISIHTTHLSLHHMLFDCPRSNFTFNLLEVLSTNHHPPAPGGSFPLLYEVPTIRVGSFRRPRKFPPLAHLPVARRGTHVPLLPIPGPDPSNPRRFSLTRGGKPNLPCFTKPTAVSNRW